MGVARCMLKGLAWTGLDWPADAEHTGELDVDRGRGGRAIVSAAALGWAAREAALREDSLWMLLVGAPGRSQIPSGDGLLMEPDDAAHYSAPLLGEAVRIARSEAPEIDFDVEGITWQVAATVIAAADHVVVVGGRSGHGTFGTIFLGRRACGWACMGAVPSLSWRWPRTPMLRTS